MIRASLENKGNGGRSSDVCCFGTLVGLPFTKSKEFSEDFGLLRLTHEYNGKLIDVGKGHVFGILGNRSNKILTALGKDLELELYVGDRHSNAPSRRPGVKGKGTNRDHSLYVTLYGDEKLFELVGTFVAQCGYYLQDPEQPCFDVPYQNPHCLTPPGKPLSTFEISRMLELEFQPALESLKNPIDLFAGQEDQDDLPETLAPPSVSTELFHHQKQALTFLLRRESGWGLKSDYQDVWKEEPGERGNHLYLNTITGRQQSKCPPLFQGGLLIDSPGLGKSLSILSLLSTDGSQKIDASMGPEGRLSRTLLVVPKSLLHMWQSEIQKHFHPHSAIKYVMYYGKDRVSRTKQFTSCDLTITTYSVVQLDWKSAKQTLSNAGENLFDYKWKRVVLDEGEAEQSPWATTLRLIMEAHIIREPSKSFARSVCALEAERRWAVTGTPIQNRLMDLFSLFKFLRCHPFDDQETFKTHVVQSWKRHDPESIGKLKKLMHCLSLRRPKNTINLLPCNFEKQHLDFSKQERQHYEQMKADTRKLLQSADTGGSGRNILNALHLITELRLMCNHGQRGLSSQPELPCLWNQREAQKRFDQLEQAGLANCSNPQCGQDVSSVLASQEDHSHDEDPWISDSLDVWCSSCYRTRNKSEGLSLKVCNQSSRKTQASTEELESSGSKKPDPATPPDILPTKLQALLMDLHKTPPNVKSVVFSSWTRTFDILKPHLVNSSIRSVRLDGSLSPTSREKVLKVFRENADVTVLLATISCGGVGLDLTAASRAYIVEPQWNPMNEAQALDRLYRWGQKSEVTLKRYLIRDTTEERVARLQRKKEDLADLAVNSKKIGREELSTARLAWLKDLVG